MWEWVWHVGVSLSIVLKIYPALLMKCAIYAHEIIKLCSKMCLTDRADICGACKQSISDGQIGPADGSDELAVLGKIQ